ncbi:unnamed protein product, partial [Discosporangium mesarthrocarpum]
DVLLVPGLGRNLFSTASARERGVNTIFTSTPHLRLGDNQFPIRTASSLYCLDVRLPASSTATPATTTPQSSALKTNSDQARLWHHRLGHLNIQDMGILDLTPGTRVSCKAGNTLPGCDVCQLSKSKQRDHPKHRTTKPTTRKLELVYTDLQGPLQPSLQNYSYIAMFMDDLTKIKKQYFLQAKSGALD